MTDPAASPEESPTDDVEQRLVECLDAEPERRRQLLARLDHDDPELADELRHRLAALDRTLRHLAPPAQPDRDEAIPERLDEFRIVRRLGSGGMGVVFEAVQESLGRSVALKLVRPDLLFFERARQRFQREVELVAGLQDPGIVPVYAVGEAQGTPYFAMELVQGGTVADALAALRGRDPRTLTGSDLHGAVCRATGREPSAQDRPPRTWSGSWIDTCLDIGRQVAMALAHAHEQGVVHRDVKPSNIALTPDGRARLLDFGLARHGDSADETRTGAVVGTLPFMAPEQLTGTAAVDERVDVYGLGVTLYEMMALQPAFDASSSYDLQTRIQGGEVVALRQRNRAVRADAATAIAVAMDPDPERRYRSVRRFGDDLQALLDGRPIVARRQPPTLRLRRWIGRNPTLALGLLAALLLFFAVPSAIAIRERQQATRLQAALDDERVARAQGERALAFLTDLFRASDPTDSPDLDLSARELLDRAAERILGELDDDPELKARLLWNLGDVYRNASAPRRALPLLEAALPLAHDSWGPDSTDLAAVLDSLGSVRWILGDLDAAEQHFRQALTVHERTGGPLQRAGELNNLALVRMARKDHEGAEPLLAQAIELYAEAGDEGRAYRADALTNLASLLIDTGRTEQAAARAEQALQAQRAEHQGPDPSLIGALNVYGRTRRALGRYADAERAYVEAATLQQQIPSANDPTLPTLYYNLYLLRRTADRLDEQAGEWLRLAAQGFERALGPDAAMTRRVAGQWADWQQRR